MKQFYLLLLLLCLGTYAHGQVPTMTPDSLQMITEEPLEDAEFPGGYEKLQTYISDNMDLTSIMNTATEPLVNTKVIVRFDIEKDGSISNAIVEKSSANCLACQKEALRLVESMPRWILSKRSPALG